MITISLCMIVKNEEAVLERCLKSVYQLVDEIIIMDTGSTDRTKEIASRYTKHVYDFPWADDFSKARNASFSKATMDYQFWLDADDVLLKPEQEKFLQLKQTLSPEIDIVMMQYDTHFDANGKPILTSHRERLLKRANNYQWIDPIHECIPLNGSVLQSDITITHKKEKYAETSDRNLKIYENLERQGIPFSPRQLYYYARELKDHQRYEKAIRYFESFLDTKKGWVEDNIASCFNLAICYHAVQTPDKIPEILSQSFLYDTPRAEICCEMGYYYKRRREYQKAIVWFSIAAGLKEVNSFGFILRDYWGFIPNLELCVCCAELGDMETAEQYNLKAEALKPESAAVLQNKAYFASLKNA